MSAQQHNMTQDYLPQQTTNSPYFAQEMVSQSSDSIHQASKPSFDSAIMDFKNKLLNRTPNRNTADAPLDRSSVIFQSEGNVLNYSQYQKKPHLVPNLSESTLQTNQNSIFSSKDDESSHISPIKANSIHNNEDQLLASARSDMSRQSRVEQMRRAIDQYKEYKSESNFSLNSSRCYDQGDNSLIIDSSQNQAPVQLFSSDSNARFNTRDIWYNNNNNANRQQNGSQTSKNQQKEAPSMIIDRNTSPAMANERRQSAKQVFDYKNMAAPVKRQQDKSTFEERILQYDGIKRNLFGGNSDTLKEQEIVTPYQAHQQRIEATSNTKLYSLKAVSQEICDSNFSTSRSDQVAPRAPYQHYQALITEEAKIDRSTRNGEGHQQEDKEVKLKAFDLIHSANSANNFAKYQNPPQSAISTMRQIGCDTQDSYLFSQKEVKADQASSQGNKDALYSIISDLKAKVGQQEQQIQDKESKCKIDDITIQKLQQQVQDYEQLLDEYGSQENLQNQIINEKNDEIEQLKNRLLESEEQQQHLQKQLASLKDQSKFQESYNQQEKMKLQEMEEVIVVCKEQIQGFDSVNIMSQTVIERLERQANEYKFELEQARDTIEHQHEMYHALLRLTDQQKLQQQSEIITKKQEVDCPRYTKSPFVEVDLNRNHTEQKSFHLVKNPSISGRVQDCSSQRTLNIDCESEQISSFNLNNVLNTVQVNHNQQQSHQYIDQKLSSEWNHASEIKSKRLVKLVASPCRNIMKRKNFDQLLLQSNQKDQWRVINSKQVDQENHDIQFDE